MKPRKLSVSVRPSAKKPEVVQIDATCLRVAICEPARDGRANEAVRRALAEHFGVAPSRVRIKSGHASRRKIIEID